MPDSDYQEFLNSLQKRGSKPYNIGHCLGSRDAWKWVRRNKWKSIGGRKMDSTTYSAIINEVNRVLVKELLEGHKIEFPHQMGSISLLSYPTRVFMRGGVLNTNYRTDWKKTLEFWYRDKAARDSHKVIKRVQKKIYMIRYSKLKARYRNKDLYMFRVNRSLGKTLGKAVEEGKVNAEELNITDLW